MSDSFQIEGHVKPRAAYEIARTGVRLSSIVEVTLAHGNGSSATTRVFLSTYRLAAVAIR